MYTFRAPRVMRATEKCHGHANAGTEVTQSEMEAEDARCRDVRYLPSTFLINSTPWIAGTFTPETAENTHGREKRRGLRQ